MAEIDALRNWRRAVGKLFEYKKQALLKVHAKRNNIKEQAKLIHEINILAQILQENPVNEENIASSLRVYPNKY